VADGRSVIVPTSGAIVAASRVGTAENAQARAGDSVTSGNLETETRGEGAAGGLPRISVGRLSVDGESPPGSGVVVALS
jgi:hypothetical protein